jgi:micrococcal nuclease
MTTPAASFEGTPPEAQPAVVTRVVDGDTIWVRPALGGESQRVRLLKIDAPETDPHHGGPQCYGAQATAFAKRLLRVGSTVHLIADRQDRDEFGRLLRYVWTQDHRFFNEEAVRQGYARTVLFPPNDRYARRLRAAEAEARAAGRGLWSCDCHGCPEQSAPRLPTLEE